MRPKDPPRASLLALSLAAALGWLATTSFSSADSVGPQAPASGPGAPSAPQVSQDVEAARAALRAGRPWHAARLLRERWPGEDVPEPDGALLLARADAGWSHWEGVVAGLEGRPWLDSAEGGEGWRLLGLAADGLERWELAARAWGAWTSAPAALRSPELPAARARLARALARSGRVADAVRELDRITTTGGAPPASPEESAAEALRSWTALTLSGPLADQGRVGDVRALLARIAGGEPARGAFDLLPRALVAAGDSAAALAAWEEVLPELEAGERRARALAALGDLHVGRGAPEAARTAFSEALSLAPRAAAGARAARGLLALGGLDVEEAERVAEALGRSGDVGRAVQAWDLHRTLLDRGGRTPGEPQRLERARFLARVPDRREDAVREFRALSTSADARVGAVALELWAALRREQGRPDDVATLREWLVERYPASPEAANVVFLRGDAAHDRQELDAALEDYRRVAEMAPAQDRAGLARMRIGQIHLLQDRPEEAARVYEAYLTDFPTGRRWEEATWWAARTRLELGDTAGGRELLRGLRNREPLSYYAVLAAELLGEPFRLDLPPGDDPRLPGWAVEGLTVLDLLEAAGLGECVAQGIAALVRGAEDDGSPSARLAVAAELVRRGYTIPGINLGWSLRADGLPWTRRLAEVVFPFLHREAILSEADERGLDPLLVAALVRQESAFDPDIRSVADAVGLMQVLPSTGEELARSEGVRPFRERMLEVPDVNLHLGTAYLAELLERWGGRLPLALSAYNAGPHRAERWQHFPEARSMVHFTERIPFAETRDYVKQITRNVALYEVLYGPELVP